MWTSGVYWNEHLYTYGRQEIQNFVERKLWTIIALDNCYLFPKNMFKHDIDSAYGVFRK